MRLSFTVLSGVALAFHSAPVGVGVATLALTGLVASTTLAREERALE